MPCVAKSARTTAIVLFAAMCAMANPSRAIAQSDSHNAATWYQKAIDQFMQLTKDQRDLLSNVWDPAEGPPPEYRAASGSVQSILQTFQRGAQQEHCDFNLDRGQGFELLMPHLPTLRRIAMVARNDAMMKMQDGDSDGAADRLAALYRLSGHTTDDEILISSLVGAAVFKMADGCVQSAIDRGILTAAADGKLLAAAKTLGSTDPFRYADAVAGEQELAISWLQKKSGEEGGIQTMLELIDAQDSPQAAAISAMDENDVKKGIEEYDATMNRMVEAFAMQDHAAGKAMLDQVMKEVEAGEHGPLVMVLIPALGKVFDRREEAEKMVADRMAMLEMLAIGKVKPEEAANAAIWYLRGIEMLEKIEPAKLQAMRAFAADVSQTINDELAAMLKDKPAQDIIDVFRDGSIKKRCNFDMDNSAARNPVLMPSYAPGINDALRLIRADTIRLLRAGDQDGAVDRLAMSCRIIGHLNGDPQLLSSLIAHRNFAQALAIIDTALNTKLIPENSKATLLDAVDRISRKDPFGYLGAMVATRQALAWPLNIQRTADADEQDRRTKAVAAVNDFTGDQLLYLLAVQDTMIRAAKNSTLKANPAKPNASSTPSSPTTPPPAPAATQPDAATIEKEDPFKRLGDVISLSDLEAVRNDVINVAPRLAKFDYNLFTGHAVALIGNISDGVKNARTDLRRAHALLQPPLVTKEATKK